MIDTYFAIHHKRVFIPSLNYRRRADALAARRELRQTFKLRGVLLVARLMVNFQNPPGMAKGRKREQALPPS